MLGLTLSWAFIVIVLLLCVFRDTAHQGCEPAPLLSDPRGGVDPAGGAAWSGARGAR